MECAVVVNYSRISPFSKWPLAQQAISVLLISSPIWRRTTTLTTPEKAHTLGIHARRNVVFTKGGWSLTLLGCKTRYGVCIGCKSQADKSVFQVAYGSGGYISSTYIRAHWKTTHHVKNARKSQIYRYISNSNLKGYRTRYALCLTCKQWENLMTCKNNFKSLFLSVSVRCKTGSDSTTSSTYLKNHIRTSYHISSIRYFLAWSLTRDQIYLHGMLFASNAKKSRKRLILWWPKSALVKFLEHI